MTRTDQMRELEKHGYSAKTTGAWSEDRITTVLAARRRDNTLALARANHTAELIDGTSRGQPGQPERMHAAAYLEEMLDKGGDALVNAVLYVGHCLSDTEARTLAEGLILLFRGQHAQRPVRLPFPEPDAAA